MMPVVETGAIFHNAAPAVLYELFIDSEKHSAATGAPAKISHKVGGKWSAHGGMISGKNLVLVPNRMIVQTWRSNEWKSAELDSIVVVRFEKSVSGGASVSLAHVGVPEYDYKDVTQGWINFYWDPWRKYLKGRKSKS